MIKRSSPYFDFLIIGAMKSGTTSLHHFLNQHPDIYTPRLKETNFFLSEDSHHRPGYQERPDHYLSSNDQKRRFSSNQEIINRMLSEFKGEAMIGDASPFYSMRPIVTGNISEKIYKHNPKMKLIYIIRNPFSRIISNYLHDLAVDEFFGRYKIISLNEKIRQHNHYLKFSLYFYQLHDYLKFFPKSQIKIVLFEDFIENQKTVGNDIANYLALPSYDFVKTYHKGKTKNRELFTENELKFDKAIYEEYVSLFDNEQKKLISEFNIKPNWDLNSQKWVKKNRQHPSQEQKLVLRIRKQYEQNMMLKAQLGQIRSSFIFKTLWPIYQLIRKKLRKLFKVRYSILD